MHVADDIKYKYDEVYITKLSKEIRGIFLSKMDIEKIISGHKTGITLFNSLSSERFRCPYQKGDYLFVKEPFIETSQLRRHYILPPYIYKYSKLGQETNPLLKELKINWNSQLRMNLINCRIIIKILSIEKGVFGLPTIEHAFNEGIDFIENKETGGFTYLNYWTNEYTFNDYKLSYISMYQNKKKNKAINPTKKFNDATPCYFLNFELTNY